LRKSGGDLTTPAGKAPCFGAFFVGERMLPGSHAQDWVPFKVCRTIVSRGFVPVCPKKQSKMEVEFPLQMCKKEGVKILGTLHVCKFNVQKG